MGVKAVGLQIRRWRARGTSAGACSGESLPRTRCGVAAGSPTRTCANESGLARIGLLLVAAFAGAIPLAAPAAAATAPVAAAQVRASYDATTKFAAARDMLKAHKVLEKAQVFMSPLRLPRELTIRTAECGASFLPYDPAKGIITICYEAIAGIQDLAKGATSDPDDLTALVTGGVIEETLHCIAEAILRVFDVPLWGREEDAADLLAAFLMLKFDEPAAEVSIIGAARLFGYKTSAVGKVDYVSEISPPAQRFYNFLCVAYGGERLGFQGVVDKGFLPKSRAPHCSGEYNTIRKAFDLRLMPHVDPDLVVKVRAIDWLHYDLDKAP